MRKYKYDKNLLKEFIKEHISNFGNYNHDKNPMEMKERDAKRIYDEFKEEIYLISPDPMNKNIVFLVYESLSENDDILFYEYDQSSKVQRNIRNQYNNIDPKFKQWINYEYFIKHLYFYKEVELTSRNILLSDGYIYNFEDMKFEKRVYDLPSNRSKLELKKIKDNDKKTLKNCFEMMYNTDETYEQFLYYILCNINKNNATQSIFLIFDISGVGKTSKILPMVELGLNNILDSGLLKKTELYNLVNKNSVIYNETQTENIDGSTLNNLADNAPLTVTRKSDTSITISKEDKPLLQLMGEALPFIKALHNGTTRRFLKVPEVSAEFLEYKSKKEHEQNLNNFYGILNEKPIEVLQYYIQEIEEKEISKKKDIIKKNMFVTLNDLSKLTENKENIFDRYFNLNPFGKYDECDESRYLIENESLNKLLEYIDNEIITISHFNDKNLRRNYLINLIKNNTGKRVRELGNHNIGGKNYFYYYCLTSKGVDLVDEINNGLLPDEKLLYIVK